MSPNRPKKPPEPMQPRPVVDGAKKAIQDPDPAIAGLVAEIRRQLVDPPDASTAFEDGARGERHLREAVCPNGANPYGDYIPVPSRDPVVVIGGEGAFAKFPKYWLDAFPAFKEEHVLALLKMARRQVRQDIVHGILRQYWLRLVAIATVAATVFQYGMEIFAWVEAHLPALRNLFQLLKIGGG